MKKKGILAVVAAVILGVAVYLLGAKPTAKADGIVEIVVVDVDENTVADKKLDFYEGDTLISLVENNFENVRIEDGFIYTIETLETPEDFASFICIYVNDEMSEVGMNDITLEDGKVISFVMTVYDPSSF
ncbi:MAG: DUF4430 domain-containing protein [Erysipelotrichaceae bacterium]|nr:DUF4430 domain-containing protein [Erysipelotrichaceae bacterium]